MFKIEIEDKSISTCDNCTSEDFKVFVIFPEDLKLVMEYNELHKMFHEVFKVTINCTCGEKIIDFKNKNSIEEELFDSAKSYIDSWLVGKDLTDIEFEKE